jgi:phospholipase/carboxylesterase
MDLKYLIRPSEKEKNSPSIFLLHGYGSNKEDLFSLEGYLPKNHTIISLEAPISLPFGGFTWFEVNQIDIINKSYYKNKDEVDDIAKVIIKNIDKLSTEYELDKTDTTVLGFSQGASICWKLGLDYSNNIRRILPISSYINLNVFDNKIDKYNNILAYTSHGLYDDIIPISLVKETILELIEYNDNITFEKFESGHTINQENLSSIIKWIDNTNI